MPDPQDTRHAAPPRRTRAALDRRAVVEQAKGIIMAERRCTVQEASAILAKAAEHSGRTTDELAVALVDSAVHRPKEIR
jgi:AmiR/NasT family two-component response regulator